jgi:hypothetical protein
MSRSLAIACALGLWGLPAAAQNMRLQPPNLSARQEHCTPQQRARCEGLEQRALEQDLSCSACGAVAPAMPPEMVAPSESSSGPAPAAPQSTPNCPTTTGGSSPVLCPQPPPLDLIPRP